MCMADRMYVRPGFMDRGVYQDAGSIDGPVLITSSDFAIMEIDQDHIGRLEHTKVHLIRS